MLYKNIIALSFTTASVLAAPLEKRGYYESSSPVSSESSAEHTATWSTPDYPRTTLVPVVSKTNCSTTVHPPSSTGCCTTKPKTTEECTTTTTTPTPSCTTTDSYITPTPSCETPGCGTVPVKQESGCKKPGCDTPPPKPEDHGCKKPGCGTEPPKTEEPCKKPGCTTPDGPTEGAFFPSALSHYDVSTGAIECDADSGLVDKDYTNKGHDYTTLITFTYPKAATGKMCQFKFSLPADAVVSGSKKIDVYTSLAPAPGCRSSWPPGNQRNNHMGQLSVEAGEFAVWDSTYGAYLTKPTACKDGETVEAFELVGVNDQDHVSWDDIKAYGAQIVYF